MFSFLYLLYFSLTFVNLSKILSRLFEREDAGNEQNDSENLFSKLMKDIALVLTVAKMEETRKSVSVFVAIS